MEERTGLMSYKPYFLQGTPSPKVLQIFDDLQTLEICLEWSVNTLKGTDKPKMFYRNFEVFLGKFRKTWFNVLHALLNSKAYQPQKF